MHLMLCSHDTKLCALTIYVNKVLSFNTVGTPINVSKWSVLKFLRIVCYFRWHTNNITNDQSFTRHLTASNCCWNMKPEGNLFDFRRVVEHNKYNEFWMFFLIICLLKRVENKSQSYINSEWQSFGVLRWFSRMKGVATSVQLFKIFRDQPFDRKHLEFDYLRK